MASQSHYTVLLEKNAKMISAHQQKQMMRNQLITYHERTTTLSNMMRRLKQNQAVKTMISPDQDQTAHRHCLLSQCLITLTRAICCFHLHRSRLVSRIICSGTFRPDLCRLHSWQVIMIPYSAYKLPQPQITDPDTICHYHFPCK